MPQSAAEWMVDMAAGKLKLRIITPTEIKVDEDVDMVVMRCVNGDVGILPGHKAFSSLLDYGIFRILNGGEERRIAIFGGLAGVENNVLTVLTDVAEWPEDVDRAIAEADRLNAELRMREREDDIDLQSDQVTLRRALVRIEVSSYPIINKPINRG